MDMRSDSLLSDIAKQCLDDSDRWFGDQPLQLRRSVAYHALAMCGEAGEFANVVKKVERGSLSIKDSQVRYQLMMELTDVFVYLMNLAGIMGIDMFKAYAHVRKLNEERFTDERSKREQNGHPRV